jgi:hypothetical protein
MSIYIEDSPRHLNKWILDAQVAGLTSTAVLSPWVTPWSGNGRQAWRTIGRRAHSLQEAGVDVLFDPVTQALQVAGVGDFRFYDQYPLWNGPRGDLSQEVYRQEHLARVFDIQDLLGLRHLAPTVLLHAGLSNDSTLALELSREAMRQVPDTWLAISGTPTFWADGRSLDAHIGALAAINAPGWLLSVVRPQGRIPAQATAEEIHGLCRSVRALSEFSPVHISHGDLAALPAVAAGASSVGSGWDQRQRVLAYSDYGPRSAAGGTGSWFERPTLRRLLGLLMKNEAVVLETLHGPLATSLGGFPALAPEEIFVHHLAVLDDVITAIVAQGSWRERFEYLQGRYADAAVCWPSVERAISPSTGGREWIQTAAAGLELYGRTEGWV